MPVPIFTDRYLWCFCSMLFIYFLLLYQLPVGTGSCYIFFPTLNTIPYRTRPGTYPAAFHRPLFNISFLCFSVADPGCLSRIRIFSIPDPGSASKNLSILSRKMVSKLSEIRSGFFIPNPDPDFSPIPDPGVKKAPDPGSGSATLLCFFYSFLFTSCR